MFVVMLQDPVYDLYYGEYDDEYQDDELKLIRVSAEVKRK